MAHKMKNGNNTFCNVRVADMISHSRTGTYQIQTNYDAD